MFTLSWVGFSRALKWLIHKSVRSTCFLPSIKEILDWSIIYYYFILYGKRYHFSAPDAHFDDIVFQWCTGQNWKSKNAVIITDLNWKYVSFYFAIFKTVLQIFFMPGSSESLSLPIIFFIFRNDMCISR